MGEVTRETHRNTCRHCQCDLDVNNTTMDSSALYEHNQAVVIEKYCDSCFKGVLDNLYYQQTDRYGETCCYCGTKLNEKSYDKSGQVSYKNLLTTNNPFRRSWDIIRLHDECIGEALKS